jgi:O-acetylserine/cysteine efflux transporter
MPFAHVLLALLVVTIWGANFIFIKFSLEEFSPLFLCTLRFLLASVPAIFFVKPPKVPFRIIVMYGMVTFALQFIFLFVGMYLGVTAGMTSLILQVQVFFSLFFAAVFLGDKPSVGQIVGAMVSFVGIGLVAFNLDQDIPLLGFLCILAAAATWGLGNLITKKVHQVNMFSFVIWGCFVASIPLLILSLIFEGPASMLDSYQHMTWLGAVSLLYTVILSTLVGYGVWNWLVGKYPVAMIVPFTLLVPVVGVLTSILVLGEPFQLWKLVAGLFVISGLYINLLSSRLFRTKIEAAPLAE